MLDGKVVWILGAGFSRPLGGPLISDLLAVREFSLIRAALPSTVSDDLVRESERVRAFCAQGIREGYWQHAEEFLEVVETAFADDATQRASYSRETVVAMAKTGLPWSGRVGPSTFDGIEALLVAARRAVVADCWTFLRGAVLGRERWKPYTAWAGSVPSTHTVVTFNYDQVPEMLAGHLRIVDPRNLFPPGTRPKAAVLKLHGSTTWARRGDDMRIEVVGDATASPLVLSDTSWSPLMGFPGPGKLESCDELLGELWGLAEERIREADEVIFMGYRFPPTDAESRSRILGALIDGRNASVKRVRVVLGPGNNATIARMRGLLSFLGDKLRIESLYCEDFLSLVALDVAK